MSDRAILEKHQDEGIGDDIRSEPSEGCVFTIDLLRISVPVPAIG